MGAGFKAATLTFRTSDRRRSRGITGGALNKWAAPFDSVTPHVLKYLDSAIDLRDLMIPTSKQLEALKGDRQGQHSIRINKQWRVCFKWRDGDAFDVEIVDYH